MNRFTMVRRGATAATILALAGALAWQTARIDAQRIDSPRIAPVPAAQWDDRQQAIMQVLAETNRDYNVFTTLLNHPDLMQDWLAFGGHVLQDNSLPPRDRELLILRTGWLCRSEYEWSRHVPLGRQAGLNDADIERIIEGADAVGWRDEERLLLRAADELVADAFITDATWEKLEREYTTEQLMDIVFTVGQYNMVSMALNSFGVQLDSDVAGFPE